MSATETQTARTADETRVLNALRNMPLREEDPMHEIYRRIRDTKGPVTLAHVAEYLEALHLVFSEFNDFLCNVVEADRKTAAEKAEEAVTL